MSLGYDIYKTNKRMWAAFYGTQVHMNLAVPILSQTDAFHTTGWSGPGGQSHHIIGFDHSVRY
jgi:hypothetical protein